MGKYPLSTTFELTYICISDQEQLDSSKIPR